MPPDEFEIPLPVTVKFNDQKISQSLKVFTVWHKTYEYVISVHYTESGAKARIQEIIEESEGSDREFGYDEFEYDEFKVEW